MRPRLLAPLIVCVALLTQLFAPISVAGQMGRMSAAVGAPHCEMHALHAAPAAENGQPPAGNPTKHDHEACVFCRLGASAPTNFETPTVARRETLPTRIRAASAKCAIAAIYYNRNAPARAPPSLV
jgi:hypothetical protein